MIEERSPYPGSWISAGEERSGLCIDLELVLMMWV